jgi:hypothetical protein
MLKCPICNEKMLYCHGDYKIPYFRHDKNTECEDIYSEVVTQEHLKGIKTIYYWLKNQKNIINLQLEKWIPETRQRPDIYFEREEQGKIKKYAIEFQCSPISTKYNERHDLYRLNQINDIWILGIDKYDIGQFESLNNIDANNIKLNGIKTKTIEREILESNNKLLYLNQSTVYKLNKAIEIGYITKFDMIYDVNSNIESNNFEQIFENDGLFINNPKYNILLDTLKNYCEELNLNSKDICKYKFTTKIETEEILFSIFRYSERYKNEEIFKCNYKDGSKEVLELFYKDELNRINSIKNKIYLFEENLIKEVLVFNQKISQNGGLKISEYKEIKQIEININNIKRFFKLYPIEYKVTCNEWESHSFYSGRSRRGNAKYETGWHLKEIEKYELSVNLEAKEVMDIINDYYKNILFNTQSIILEELFLSNEEVLKYEKIKNIKEIVRNSMEKIATRFDNIKKYFYYNLNIDNLNQITIEIKEIFDLNFIIDINEETMVVKSNIVCIDKRVSIKDIHKDIYIVLNNGMSDMLRYTKYNQI